MKGKNPDGTHIDVSDKLNPLWSALIARQAEKHISGRQLSKKIGKSQSSHWNFVTKARNPTLGRVAWWAALIDVQEFGVAVATDVEYVSCPIYDCEKPVPWIIIGDDFYPDLRKTLEPVRDLLKDRRRALFGRAENLAREMGIARSTLANLECGTSLINPTAAYLAKWAGAARVESLALYVIIDGAYTEAEML
jgi:transcriptional regulator with XRE-family HTH domain